MAIDRDEANALVEAAALAMEIADYAAPSELESNLQPVCLGGERWFDLESWSADEREEFSGCLRYCELRGLLQHHPDKPNLIRCLEP